MEATKFKHYFESLKVMLATLIYRQHSHEQRDKHLSVMQSTIESWIDREEKAWHSNTNQQYRVLRELRACWLMLVPNREHETHTDVKNRLRLVDEMATNSLYVLQVEAEKEREAEFARHRRCHSDPDPSENDIPEASQEDTITQSLKPWEEALDELEDEEGD